MSHIGLSKSKYAVYCQCPKLLWLSQYRTDEATPDAQAESRMEIGIQVSELARAYFEGTMSAIELYPDGSQNRTAMLKRTQQLIDAATPVIASSSSLPGRTNLTNVPLHAPSASPSIRWQRKSPPPIKFRPFTEISSCIK